MIKIVFLMTSCKKSGPVQQMLNIIKNLDRAVFKPYLVTIYNEDEHLSQLHLYEPYVEHFFAPTSKKDILIGRDKVLRDVLKKISPDLIHSLGVFPDFAISRMKRYKHVTTLRNYVYQDYPAKFGRLKGFILALLHIYAMKRTTKTITCSASLSKVYKKCLNMDFDFIRNGVDVVQFKKVSESEKMMIRNEIGLPQDSFVFVYTGQIIERKNIDFLLATFSQTFHEKNIYLLVLGGGQQLEKMKEKYGSIDNIVFRGNVLNINHYLNACDAYVSASKSEGLPNGVLEAMATGLPVILSDIPQHIEVFETNPKCGFVFNVNRSSDLSKCLKQMVLGDCKLMGMSAYDSVNLNFSAKFMAEKYQELYKSVVTKE